MTERPEAGPAALVDLARLAADWAATLAAAQADASEAEVVAAGAALIERWAEPHRRYHDLEHLTEVLAALDLLAAAPGEVDPAAVRLAAWFHDAVYLGHPGQDEEDSARLAEQVLAELAVPAGLVARVAALVRMTAAHDPADGDPAAAVLSDADLAILAAPPDRYRRYVEAVRAEYRRLPDQVFRAGRAQVLGALAARRPLFATAAGRRHWEDAARANLAAELAELTATP